MNKKMQSKIRDSIQDSLQEVIAFVKWIAFAVLSGIVVGLLGTMFYFCLSAVTGLRAGHPWIVWLLPVGGLVIVGTYHFLHDEKDSGTNLVISSIHSGDELPLQMAPSIFFSTLVTHMLGGSAGREGAALQLGGSIGNAIGKVFRFDEKDRHIMTMCGMSAAFSALFGTPMAAAFFSMEVVSVGVMYYAALVPCVISALLAHAIASYFGASAESFPLKVLPEFAAGSAIKIAVLAVLCAFISVLFCILLHQAAHWYQKLFKNAYLRIFVGGCIVVALTLIVGSQIYNGSGIDLVGQCMEGQVRPEMFLLKMLFTAATLGAGYKGGEIVPSFCIGATFGCLFGTLLGFSPQLCTAVGMAAVFCGVTNCPITSLLISFEMFGYEGMPYFLLAVALSYMMSGYHGLYHTQKIVYSKFKTDYINKKVL